MREAARIASFLDTAVAEGRLTAFDRELIHEEGREVFRAAGYMGGRDEVLEALDDDSLGVVKQSNHRERSKLASLRPELADSLTQHIEERQYHPLSAVPAELEATGAALQKYRSLMAFIQRKRNDGTISHDDAHTAYEPAIAVFNDSGVDYAELNLTTDKAVLAAAEGLMRERLRELRPELGETLASLGTQRSR